MCTATELSTLAQTYRKGLFEDVLPFGIRHSVDREKGSFLFGLDRGGKLIHRHFPDAEHREYLGYWHRDVIVSMRSKVNRWKRPFHLSRMQGYC